MELFFLSLLSKGNFGFAIRIGLWQVNELRPFSIGFSIVTIIQRIVFLVII